MKTLLLLAAITLAIQAQADDDALARARARSNEYAQEQMANAEHRDLLVKNRLMALMRSGNPDVSVSGNFITISVGKCRTRNIEALATSLAMFELLVNKEYADENGFADGAVLTFIRLTLIERIGDGYHPREADVMVRMSDYPDKASLVTALKDANQKQSAGIDE